MPREIQQLVNSPMLWMITLMSIALVLGMAAYFLVKSIKVAKSIGTEGTSTHSRPSKGMPRSARASIYPIFLSWL